MLALPFNRRLITIAGSVAIAWGTIAIAPSIACRPAPDSRPTPLTERLETTPYVFAGTVTAIQDQTLTIQVQNYYKGQGAREITLTGFNSHSCSDYITETGQTYLFFAQDTQGQTWEAFYDGAFGSVRPWSTGLQQELQQLQLAQNEDFPPEIFHIIRSEITQRTNIKTEQIELLSTQKRTWPNGCLGLELPGQGCTQALVEGWLVRVQARQKEFIYRTDIQGRQILLQNGLDLLPHSVENRILREVTRRFPIQRRQLNITQAYPRTWGGCYGLGKPDDICPTIAILGWQVVVQGGDHQWVFHTDGTGSEIHLNEELSY